MANLVIDETLLNAMLSDAIKVVEAEKALKLAKKEAIANFKKLLKIDDPQDTLHFYWPDDVPYLAWKDSEDKEHRLEINNSQMQLIQKMGLNF